MIDEATEPAGLKRARGKTCGFAVKVLASIIITLVTFVLFWMINGFVIGVSYALPIFVLAVAWLGALLVIMPLQWVGRSLEAKDPDFVPCFAALLVSAVLYVIGTGLSSRFGFVCAFLLSAAAAAFFLRTTFVRGVALAVMQIALSLLFAVVVYLILIASLVIWSRISQAGIYVH
jgi:hypothetical protein